MGGTTLVVSDPAVLEVLYDPLRHDLFQRLSTPRSVPELARAMGVPTDRLYYHVKRLVHAGLVEQVETRATGNGSERVYAAVARQIAFEGDAPAGSDAPGGALRAATRDLERGLQAHADGAFGDGTPALLSAHTVRLAPTRAEELETRLRSLVAEYASDDLDDDHIAVRFGILAALAPLPEDLP